MICDSTSFSTVFQSYQNDNESGTLFTVGKSSACIKRGQSPGPLDQ